MERNTGRCEAPASIDVQRAIQNLEADREFVEMPRMMRRQHVALLPRFAEHVAAIGNRAFDVVNFYNLKADYFDFLTKTDYAQNVAKDFSWVFVAGSGDVDLKGNIIKNLNSSKLACQLIVASFKAIRLVGVREDQSVVTQKLRFSPSMILLYKTGHLNMATFFEMRPWDIMNTEFINDQIREKEKAKKRS